LEHFPYYSLYKPGFLAGLAGRLKILDFELLSVKHDCKMDEQGNGSQDMVKKS